MWLNYKGHSSRAGVPFTFLLRDILQFDTDIDQTLSRVASATRTCSIFMGVGDGKENRFKAMEYSHETVQIWNDRNAPAIHQVGKPGMVFVDKHPQPSSHPCLPALMREAYGKLTPATVYQDILPRHESGDMHAAVYDYKNGLMFVSNAAPYNPKTGAKPAYDRQFIRLDMNAAFAMDKPQGQ